MNVYTLLQHIDEMIDRHYPVSIINNQLGTDVYGKDTFHYWRGVWCFARPEDLTSELVSHLQPLTPEWKIPFIRDFYYTQALADQAGPIIREPGYRLPEASYKWNLMEHRNVEKSRKLLGEALGLEFVPGPLPVREVPPVYFKTGDRIVEVNYRDGRPPPSKKMEESSHVMISSEENIQILYGLRAVLLSLCDMAGKICSDVDFIGLAPAKDALRSCLIMRDWSLKDMIPNFKFWKDYPLASFLRNDTPPKPKSWPLESWDPLFGGRLRDFLRRLCHPTLSAHSPQIFRACFELAQSKRGFAKVPDEFEQNAYAKHRDSLSIPPPPQSESLVHDLKRFLNVFFRNYRPRGLMEKLSKQEASTAASNVSRRDQGGAREVLRSILQEIRGVETDGLQRMVETDQGLVEERGISVPTYEEWVGIANRPLDLRSRIDHDTLHIVEAMELPENLPIVKVVALQEPLKIRIITKMDTLSTFLCKPLQKSLWNYLQTFPQFSLTSRPLGEQDLHDLNHLEVSMFGDRESADWVSGDYSAATDGLDIQATKLAVEHVKKLLAGDDRVLRKHIDTIIYEQILVYPDWTDLAPVVQENGQLMGSVLSFVFLCILNLFTYVQSLETEQREAILSGRLSLRSLPVKINGDDILFRATPSQYERWIAGTKSVGFTLSQGKNFVHPCFFTVNSQPLVFTRQKPDLPLAWSELDELPEYLTRTRYEFQILGYMNIGLLLNIAATTDERGRYSALPLRDWYEWGVLGAMNTKRAHNLFLHYHKSGIEKQTRFGRWTLNLFAHPLLGGLGFETPEGVEPRFSEPQRHLAFRLLDGAKQRYFGPGGQHPLTPFLSLQAETGSGPGSLGTKSAFRNIHTMLVSPTGPLQESHKVFDPDFNIRSTPLVSSYGPVEDVFLRSSCRLTNKELTQILKGSNHGRKEMLPLDQMTSFPFRVVTYDPEKEIEEVSEEEEENQLIETISSPGEEVEVLELWELPELPFTPLDLTESLRQLRSLRTDTTPLRSMQKRINAFARSVRVSQGLDSRQAVETRGRKYSRKGGTSW